jgi:hypothetical protein
MERGMGRERRLGTGRDLTGGCSYPLSQAGDRVLFFKYFEVALAWFVSSRLP